ncbi:BlaI/MecI/CopY family transcriptional regulator [Actinomycetota bacterium Odt1-20B]
MAQGRAERTSGPRRRAQGELEAQVLAALAEARGPVGAAWVQERVGGDLAYTTVMTILTRLLAKGVVTRERAGRSFAWSTAAGEAGLAAFRMRKVLDGERDREAVLASFVTTLTPDDEQLLRELLGEADAGTGTDAGLGPAADVGPGAGRATDAGAPDVPDSPDRTAKED